MSSINDDIFDRSIDHSAMTRLAENGIQSDVQRIIRRHKDRLRKGLSVKGTNVTSKAALNNTIKPEVSRFVKELDSSMGAQLKEIGLAEVDFTTNNLNKSMSKFAIIKRPNAGKILDEIVGTNIKGDGTFSARIRGLGSSELTRIQGAISNGVSKGLTQKQIIRDVIGTTKLTSAQATSLVRTGITRTQTVAQLRTYEGNKEILKGMRFTAVLDNKTSAICAHHDGQVYDVDDQKFAPPLHWRCRSTLVPVVKSHSELLEGKSDIIKKTVLNTLKAQGVARLNGASPSKENYGTWLKKQSQDVKLRHLDGDAMKVELFNKGQIPLKNFTNPEGKSISITALRRLDNKSTAVVPTKQRVISAAASATLQVQAPNPRSLIRNAAREDELRTFFRTEANNVSSNLSVVDYRGTSIVGKRASRRRSNNQFDERNQGADPLTGEVKSTLVYSPDFTTLQERIDYLKASKTLSIDEKNFIERFAISLENDGVSINQQTAIVENLRVVFERFARDKKPWENSVAVIRAELKNSVVNTSRILDRRSRARSSQFASFNAGTKSEASVQILGRHTSFDDIAARTLTNQRLVRDWDSTEGLTLAKTAYLKGRAPMASYFPKPSTATPELPNARKNILKQIEKLPFGKRLARTLEGKPNDSLLADFLKDGKEQLRRILDLEWTYALLRENYVRKAVLPSTIRKREVELSKIMKSIATGKSTDYDTLSINIGKRLYENNKSDFDIFFSKPGLPEFHRAGSKILEGLKAQGKLKVGLRGTTRRGILDLDSGRPELGSFKDTISREVTIVDPSMLALQRASRELVYSRRIGIVNPRDRIYAQVGRKDYVDARGRPTGESAITRRAGANYDTDLVDRDFANMLNHAMDSEWEVDSDFASFFTDLVHFRDPRGNVAKFDDLNGFRKIILARGDAGAGLIQTVKWHLQRGGTFRNPVQIDGRGRVYSVGYLHPAGGELIRPFINSAQRVAFTPEILYEMKIQIGALVGEASTVLTNTGRIAAFEANEKALRELGELLLSKTQRPARLRSFLEHPLVQATEADHLPKLARFALEYTRVYNHTNGNLNSPSLKTYFTRLTSENDASASGAQLIAMSTRNMQLAQNSNVVATNRKNRLYDLVAEATMSDIRFRQINIANDLTFADMAKAAKGQNMVALIKAQVKLCEFREHLNR